MHNYASGVKYGQKWVYGKGCGSSESSDSHDADSKLHSLKKIMSSCLAWEWEGITSRGTWILILDCTNVTWWGVSNLAITSGVNKVKHVSNHVSHLEAKGIVLGHPFNTKCHELWTLSCRLMWKWILIRNIRETSDAAFWNIWTIDSHLLFLFFHHITCQSSIQLNWEFLFVVIFSWLCTCIVYLLLWTQPPSLSNVAVQCAFMTYSCFMQSVFLSDSRWLTKKLLLGHWLLLHVEPCFFKHTLPKHFRYTLLEREGKESLST